MKFIITSASLFFIRCFYLWCFTAFFILMPTLIGTAFSESQSITLLAVHTPDSGGAVYEFDRKALEDFPQKTIATKTPWTNGILDFSGPLLRDLLSSVDGSGSVLRCMALNEYSVDIPMDDILRYDVIIAMKKNGENMSTREKGPLWVIYPWSEKPELWKETFMSRSIWQLREIRLIK